MLHLGYSRLSRASLNEEVICCHSSQLFRVSPPLSLIQAAWSAVFYVGGAEALIRLTHRYASGSLTFTLWVCGSLFSCHCEVSHNYPMGLNLSHIYIRPATDSGFLYLVVLA